MFPRGQDSDALVSHFQILCDFLHERLRSFFKKVNDCLQWTFSLFNSHKFERLCFSFDLSDHTLAIINSMLVFMLQISLLLVKHKLFGSRHDP